MSEPRWYSLSFAGRISRGPYFSIGVILTAVKVAINWLLTSVLFQRPWQPTPYPITGEIRGLFSLDSGDQFFYLTMLAISIPFLAVGLSLTARRLRDVGWPIWLVCLFFTPAPLNLVFLIVLSALPSVRPVDPPITWIDDAIGVPPVAKSLKSSEPDGPSDWPAVPRAIVAILFPLPFAAAVVWALASFERAYGTTLFLGLPFVLPMISVIAYGYRRRISYGQAILLGIAWLGVVVLMMLVVKFEGLICILMAMPLAIPIVLLGSSIGYAILEVGPGRPREVERMLAVLLATLPLMMGAEHLSRPGPPLYECVTSVEVDAPAEVVWRRVISFPDLPPPTDWLSRAGVAYPIRARIEGTGVGAVRHCEFSTGPFVEPIEVWDEPKLLRFAVTNCPSPMREWNPFFEIHPPHLDGFLVSKRGQFHLIKLPDGRTRLEGTTWYQHGLWPADYWRLWSDSILHGIHQKVLNHVKSLAEGDVERPQSGVDGRFDREPSSSRLRQTIANGP